MGRSLLTQIEWPKSWQGVDTQFARSASKPKSKQQDLSSAFVPSVGSSSRCHMRNYQLMRNSWKSSHSLEACQRWWRSKIPCSQIWEVWTQEPTQALECRAKSLRYPLPRQGVVRSIASSIRTSRSNISANFATPSFVPSACSRTITVTSWPS